MNNKVKERIMTLITERQSQIDEINKGIESAKEAIAAAGETVSASYSHYDVDGYHKAQEELRRSKDTLVFLTEKLDALKKTKSVNDTEYGELKTALFEEGGKAVDKGREKIIKLIDAMVPVSEETAASIGEINDLLHILQHDLFLDDACLTTGEGKKVYIASREVRFTDFSVNTFVEDLKRSYFYQAGVKDHGN